MGLPSGNRWAVSNLDKTGPYFFQESPFQAECSFFSWGNVIPHNPISGTGFDYDFGGINASAPYYEGQPYGETPGSLLTGNITLSMDAARKLLGSPWRMPSDIDFSELLSYSIFIDANGDEIESTITDKRVFVNDVRGLYLKSKINGARLFLSCNGQGLETSWSRKTIGLYWSTHYLSVRTARSLEFTRGGVSASSAPQRYCGQAIRPIWNPRELT